MRKSKIIKIDELEITVKELRVRDIYELFDGEFKLSIDVIDDLLQRCTDIDRNKLLDMTPTDLQTLFEGFKEVNAAFLDIAGRLGLDGLPEVLRENLQEQFAISLRSDTAP